MAVDGAQTCGFDRVTACMVPIPACLPHCASIGRLASFDGPPVAPAAIPISSRLADIRNRLEVAGTNAVCSGVVDAASTRSRCVADDRCGIVERP